MRIFFICFTGTVPDIVNSEGTTCTVHTEGGNIRTCTSTYQTSTHENMMNDEMSGLVGVRVVPGLGLVVSPGKKVEGRPVHTLEGTRRTHSKYK